MYHQRHAKHVPSQKHNAKETRNGLKSERESLWHLANVTSTSQGVQWPRKAEGAVILWKRSIELNNICFKWIVSDGDSKSFNSVEHVYDDYKVVKLGCVGHVQKRMGNHLLSLRQVLKAYVEISLS